MFKPLALAAIATLLVNVFASSLRSEDSPQFRGPSGNGVYSDSLPQEWSDQAGIRWTIDVPGGGWSSPVCAKGRIFVTTAVSADDSKPKGFGDGVKSMGDFYRSKEPDQPYSFELHCLNASDGKTIWKKPVVSRIPPYKVHPSNSYATESPVTDGDFVYTYFASVGVASCFDSQGQQIWTRELGAFKTGNDFGTGSSLALHDGKVFVQCDSEEQSFLCALDTKTGKDVWRDNRDSRTSWSSPVIWKNEKRTELVACGSGTVTSYDPADGTVLWKLTGTGGAYSASPTFDTKRLYLGQSGRNSRGPLVAVNAGASGEMTFDDVSESQLAWVTEKSAPGMCSPVVVDGRVYVLSRGILSCHDAATGDQIYKERLDNASSVTSSLWVSGTSLFAMNEAGDTAVIKSGETFQLTRTNSIEGLFWSTPSTTDSALLIRSSDKLHCIAK